MTEASLHKRGFTLIELLLVIVIIGVLAAISVPSFVRSMQGNRLRSAARTVAAAGRYARSMALLHQRPIIVTFELDGHNLTVDLAARRPAPLEDEEDLLMGEPFPGADFGEPDGRRSQSVEDEPAIKIERYLQGVRIHRVQITEGRRTASFADRERVQIVYGSNGRCLPHEIVLHDDDGGQLVIAVDALGSTQIRER